MPSKTADKPVTRQLLLVKVSDKYHPKYGAACFDAEARWMTLEAAARFNPSLKESNTPLRPQLSGRTPPTNIDIDKLTRYEQELKDVPALFSVQRALGRTFQEAGIWLVSGPDVLNTAPVIQNQQGIWETKPGVEWEDGPFFTIAEARAAHPEIRPADIAPTQPGPKDTPETIALRAEVKKLRESLANQEALREAQTQEGQSLVIEMNDRVGKQMDEK